LSVWTKVLLPQPVTPITNTIPSVSAMVRTGDYSNGRRTVNHDGCRLARQEKR
jgi:hypothetical protein